MKRAAIITLTLAMLGQLALAPARAQVTAPTISPSTGSYNTEQTVTISAPSGTIFYTVDGTRPTTSSPEYTTSLAVTAPTQINAVAYSAGAYSAVATAYLDVDSGLAAVLAPGSLVLRLRGGFGAVTNIGSPAPIVTWNDLSGSGNNATAAAGVQPFLAASPINNLPAATFNGSSQYLSLPSGFADFTNGCSLFIVASPSALTANQCLIDLGDGASGNDIMFQASNSGSLGQFTAYNGTSGTSAYSATALTQGQYQLLEAIQTPGTSNGTALVYVNGVAGTANSSMNNFPNTTRTNNSLGRAAVTANFYAGSIAELLIYSTALTESQHAEIAAYLMQKYQILSQAPPAPIISVAGGTLSAPTNVVISAQPGTTTVYTLDGATPDSNSTPYLGSPIPINYSQTLKAVSILNGVSSSVDTASYTLNSTQWPAPSSSDTTTPSINIQQPTPTQ